MNNRETGLELLASELLLEAQNCVRWHNLPVRPTQAPAMNFALAKQIVDRASELGLDGKYRPGDMPMSGKYSALGIIGDTFHDLNGAIGGVTVCAGLVAEEPTAQRLERLVRATSRLREANSALHEAYRRLQFFRGLGLNVSMHRHYAIKACSQLKKTSDEHAQKALKLLEKGLTK